MKLILASNSPRRKDLLSVAGYVYEVIPSVAEENNQQNNPYTVALQNAQDKAREVFERLNRDDIVVLGADTVVYCGNEIFGKPKDEEDAFYMLSKLSDSTHSVITGCSVVHKDGVENFYSESKVKFRKISPKEINAYIKTGEPMDKAGAYGIQEKASVFVESFDGDFLNIIGLPVSELYGVLAKLKVLPLWQKDTTEIG